MKARRKVWISDEAYKRAKIEAARSESNLIDYFDKVIKGDEPKRKKEKGGYYGFLK